MDMAMKTPIQILCRLPIILLIAFLPAITSCSSSYPVLKDSQKAKHQSKSSKRYGKANESNIRIKSNYKIKN
jgi:hypothetical protein